MTTIQIKTASAAPTRAGGYAFHALASLPFGPRVVFGPETGAGEGGAPSNDAAAAEAAAAAAAKAAQEAADAEALAAKEAKEAADAAEAAKNLTEAEKAALLKEVMDKKTKLKVEKEARERAEAELKKFEGIDLAKVQALLAAEKEREEKELEAKGEFDRLKARIAEERAAEKAAWEAERAALQGQISSLNGHVDGLTIGQSFATSAFIADDLVLTPTKARVLYGSHFEMQDGKTVAYDKPAGAAGRTLLVDAGGNALTFDSAMRKIIEADPEKESLLKAKMAPGAGSKHQPARKPQSQTQAQMPELRGARRILAALNAESAKAN